MNNRVRVLLVGPSPDIKGGISSVIRLMLMHTPSNLLFRVLATTLPHNSLSSVKHLKRNPIRYYAVGMRGLIYFVRCLSQVGAIVRSEGIDLAHVHFSSRGSTFRKYFITRALSKQRTPYVLHAHGGKYHEFYQRAPALVKMRIDWMLRSADGLIVLSEHWREFYKRLMGSCTRPLWVMPNPVELPEHWQPIQSETLHLLFLGRMGEHKGVDRVLQAVVRLPQSLRERVRLSMAGDGDVDAVRRLAAELGLQTQVDIRNWIVGEEKERWLRETNAFILPSRAEGLPMAMLEAMAYGKALIVSPVGGIPEFVSDGQEGFLVPPDDIEAISQAIARLAENPELRAQMGRAARARVESLDVNSYMGRMAEIYHEVLATVPNRSK